jgi:hypothetical protein
VPRGQRDGSLSNGVIENHNRGFPACSIVPQAIMLQRASTEIVYKSENVKKYGNRAKCFGSMKIYDECEEIDEVCVVTYLIA